MPAEHSETGKPQKDTPEGPRRPYRKPEIEKLGHIAEVTRKSGAIPDANQVTKPGKGGG